MAKIKDKLIIFMPSIDGGGVEKNLFIISNYLSKKIDDIILITFDDRFNHKFNKEIKIINFIKKPNGIYSKYFDKTKTIVLTNSLFYLILDN